MSKVRHPAVAGAFYPGDPGELSRILDEYLAEAKTDALPPKALIAPHAGYIYSGPVAATAYARLKNARQPITRVILLGPSHRVPFLGLAVPSDDYFETPLGEVPIDRESVERILPLSQVYQMDQAHAYEHSLEVQIPFLQKTLGEFTLVPLVVGNATGAEVAEVLEELWGGPETLIVISSDLSHYLDYQSAKDIDTLTSKAIEGLHGEALEYNQACGRIPVQGLLIEAQRHGLHAKTLDLRNSGDTAGPKDHVVGYGAYAIG